jgi:hypothetical protein
MRSNARRSSPPLLPLIFCLLLFLMTVFSLRTTASSSSSSIPSTSTTTTTTSKRNSKKSSTQLFQNFENTDSLLEATNLMKELILLGFHQNEPNKFQKMPTKIGNLVSKEFNNANDFSNRKKFGPASEIYKMIFDNLGEMLDEVNRRYCQDQYAEMIYRLALGGNREWSELKDVLGKIKQRTAYQDYLIHFAETNMKNKRAKWRAPQETWENSETLPYVLRFHMPQEYHTPTLAHFGHVSEIKICLFMTLTYFLFLLTQFALRPCWTVCSPLLSHMQIILSNVQ